MMQLPRGSELSMLESTVMMWRNRLGPMFRLRKRGVRTGSVTVRLLEVELATVVTRSIVIVVVTSGLLGTRAI